MDCDAVQTLKREQLDQAQAPPPRLANPTGSIIQAPRVNQLLILKINVSKKDFARIFLEYL